MNRSRAAVWSARIIAATATALTLSSCGMLGGAGSTPASTTPGLASLTDALSSPPSLDGSFVVTVDGASVTPATSAVSVSGEQTAVAGSTPPTEAIGFDELPDATVPDADQIGALAYGIEAAADPFRISISASEQACLTKASDGLSDEQIDDALASDDASGEFGQPVSGCLSASNSEAFAVWHQIDVELADATDQQYRCVEQRLVDGATHEHLNAALNSCGVKS